MNLLSISQIFDQDFMVLFSKGKCLVMDESGKKFISGIRTLDNCYGLVHDVDIVCNSIWLPNEDLWHQRIGHASCLFKKVKIKSASSKDNHLLLSQLVSSCSTGDCTSC